MTLKFNIEIVLFVLVSYCLITFYSSAPANTINHNAHGTNIISEHKHIVMLNPSVNTDKRYIFLGDFFTNIGKKADIRVAYSPQPGKKSRFDARWLYRIAKAYKINWRPLTLKTHSIVKRSSQIIFRDEVEAALIGELRSFGYHENFEIEMGQQANRIHVATNEQPKITVDGLSINKATGRFIGNLVI